MVVSWVHDNEYAAECLIHTLIYDVYKSETIGVSVSQGECYGIAGQVNKSTLTRQQQ